MRLLVLSDLHLEFDSTLEIPAAARPDVVVLAGDIWTDDGAVAWADERFDCPVVLVAGNHEFYHREMGAVRRKIARSAAGTRVHFLDDGQVILGGVRFVGATLWTDFNLHGAPEAAMALAQHGMSDFHIIQTSTPAPAPTPTPAPAPGDDAAGDPPRPFTAADSARLHADSRRFLERALATAHPGPTVVVTHHLPSPRSVAARWADYPLSAAFASDLDELIVRHRPALWIHGHTHDSFDYRLGDTRVVCNPRGYLPHEPNTAFDPGLVVTLE